MAQQHGAPEFIRLPDKLLAAFAEASRRQAAIGAEAAQIEQHASNIANAYLMGIGVDTDRYGYRIDLEQGGLALVGRRSPLAAVPAEPEVIAAV